MPAALEPEQIREAARLLEGRLPAEQRKRLGQFFTGVRLGKLLAHLALAPETRAALDPMAGHGDLLDATNEAALERGTALDVLAGIELDQEVGAFCEQRLKALTGGQRSTRTAIVRGNAFNIAALRMLPQRSYDLTIANPPYVRYQTQNTGGVAEAVRDGLTEIIDRWVDAPEHVFWRQLAAGYSGLADLSVPAWILSALTVRPAGRLALVVPATWRSREYGDIIRYLLLRFYDLESIVEDTQPGWFSDALVRTHLIVARRLPPERATEGLARRSAWGSARWITIAPDAADSRSLVGAAFHHDRPDADFAHWLANGAAGLRRGIAVRSFPLIDEWLSLKQRVVRRPWYPNLEQEDVRLPLFQRTESFSEPVPDTVRDFVGNLSLSTLEEVGIRTGQGLRTGCNRFFYVEALGPRENGSALVRTSEVFKQQELKVPESALEPVLRRQSELPDMERGLPPTGRVLNLAEWILPEDAPSIERARAIYRSLNIPPPRIMPDELAAFVRRAANEAMEDGEYVPELSAVRTNARAHRPGVATPRFWYMLPEFMPRHRPAAFVPRVNHETPWTECNLETPILIDANFSTFWPTDRSWTRFGIKALLNSVWVQLFMESLGTPLGGGALKLEAVHLRRVLIPPLSNEERSALSSLGSGLTRNGTSHLAEINAIVVKSLFPDGTARPANLRVMYERIENLRRSRLRKAA